METWEDRDRVSVGRVPSVRIVSTCVSGIADSHLRSVARSSKVEIQRRYVLPIERGTTVTLRSAALSTRSGWKPTVSEPQGRSESGLSAIPRRGKPTLLSAMRCETEGLSEERVKSADQQTPKPITTTTQSRLRCGGYAELTTTNTTGASDGEI
jgi:hypothetical protein